MIKNTAQILFISLLMLSLMPSAAYAQEVIKDTVYFMKDDNEFSPEEMDEEAQYMYDKCTTNSIRSVYFDCGCLAGAFRQAREKQGAYLPQEIIMNSLITDNERGCTNSVAIAGEAYEKCMVNAKIFRDREKNNKQYCECVARTTAKNFKKKPFLSSDNLTNVAVDAALSCDS